MLETQGGTRSRAYAPVRQVQVLRDAPKRLHIRAPKPSSCDLAYLCNDHPSGVRLVRSRGYVIEERHDLVVQPAQSTGCCSATHREYTTQEHAPLFLAFIGRGSQCLQPWRAPALGLHSNMYGVCLSRLRMLPCYACARFTSKAFSFRTSPLVRVLWWNRRWRNVAWARRNDRTRIPVAAKLCWLLTRTGEVIE